MQQGKLNIDSPIFSCTSVFSTEFMKEEFEIAAVEEDNFEEGAKQKSSVSLQFRSVMTLMRRTKSTTS